MDGKDKQKHTFNITKGDAKICKIMEKQRKICYIKVLGNIVFTLIFNVVCNYNFKYVNTVICVGVGKMKLNKFINQILIRLSSAIEILLSYDDRSNNYKENYNYKKMR